MILNNILNQLKQHYYSSKGFKDPKKTIIIESDDWGSIRMESQQALSVLDQEYSVGKSHYNRLDSLERSEDLTALYDVLKSHKNSFGDSPIITANFNVANPDFDKIQKEKFKAYHYEEFVDSYRNYNANEDTFKLVTEGLHNKIFFPQYHGREHVQVDYWMRDLAKKKPETIKGFENKFFGFSKNQINTKGYLSAFDIETEEHFLNVKERIADGYNIFERIFGYPSQSIIPPQNTIHPNLNPILKNLGVNFLQGARVNKHGTYLNYPSKTQKRFMGKKNAQGIINLVRNVSFEPSYGKIDWVEKSLNEIEIAFRWKKPAIICSHRVNFIGKLSESNRKNSLDQLDKLLGKIIKRWPDVMFLNSSELGNLINKTKVSNEK